MFSLSLTAALAFIGLFLYVASIASDDEQPRRWRP